MAFRIQIRRDTSQKWTINNPTLLEGEFGYETNTTYLKVGDGVTPWNDLAYWQGGLTGAGLTVKKNNVIIQSPTSILNFSEDFVVLGNPQSYTSTIGLANSPQSAQINIFEDDTLGLTGVTGFNFINPQGLITYAGKMVNLDLLKRYTAYFSVTILLSGGNFSTFVSSRGPDGNPLDGEPWNFILSNNGNNINILHNTGKFPMGLATHATNSGNVFIKNPNATSTGGFSLVSDSSYNSFTVYAVNYSNTGADYAGTVEIVWTFGQ